MVVTGSSVESTRAAIALVRTDPQRFRCTAGIHPHHAAELDAAQLQALAQLARRPRCGGRRMRPRLLPQLLAARRAASTRFAQQLELAVATAQAGVPAPTRCARRFRSPSCANYRPRLAGGVAHCFTGGAGEARAYLDLDLYIGITGWICDERRGLHLREVVRHIPADRLLIETDAPYLLPRDLQPKPQSRRNEPMYLPHVLAAIAPARGESVERARAQITTRNALRLSSAGRSLVDRLERS